MLRAAPLISGLRGHPSLRLGRGCACARTDAGNAPHVSHRRAGALHDEVLLGLGEGAGERGGQAGGEGARHQSLMKTPERGVGCALELGVPGGTRQQVPDGGLESWWPLQKGPTGVEVEELLKGLQLGTRSSGGGVSCHGNRVHMAPSHQSCCSWLRKWGECSKNAIGGVPM